MSFKLKKDGSEYDLKKIYWNIKDEVDIKEEIDSNEANYCTAGTIGHGNTCDEWESSEDSCQKENLELYDSNSEEISKVENHEQDCNVLLSKEILFKRIQCSKYPLVKLRKLNIADYKLRTDGKPLNKEYFKPKQNPTAKLELKTTKSLLNFEHNGNHKCQLIEKIIFKCYICTYWTKLKKNLRSHLRVHTGEKPFKCDVCSYTAAHRSNLRRHLRVHTGEKPFKCDICSYTAAQRSSVQQHLRVHTGERPFKCDICSYTAAQKSHLREHLRVHTGQKREKHFKCDICSYTTAWKSHLREHLKVHTGEPLDLNINELGIKGHSKQNLTLAVNSDFEKNKSLVDDEESAESTSAFGAHFVDGLFNVKNKENPKVVQKNKFKCSFCSYQTKVKHCLKIHSRTHTGEKPFKCGDCSFGTARKTHLQAHLRIHTGERPFKCGECSFSAARKTDLQAHLRIHTGEKPFKCSYCSYSAAQRSAVKRHLKIHTGERPFKCEECSYSAARGSHLKAHLRIHSGEREKLPSSNKC